MAGQRTAKLAIFPLPGALLFPRAQLPLHIFEPRYRAMVGDAMAGDKRIGMIQPRDRGEPPALFDVGCVGLITRCDTLPDGRCNLVLAGVERFHLLRELATTTPYRQIEAAFGGFDDAADPPPLDSVLRAALEGEARRYAERHGYAIDWDAVGRVDDEALVNGIAQIAPFDPVAKQALLETVALAARADLVIQFMQFEAMAGGRGEPAGGDEPGTLQ